MGLFFDDPKPPELKPEEKRENQSWIGVLLGGIFYLAGIILIQVLAGVSFIAKPLFAYLFTFEGRSRQQIGSQMTIAFFIIASPLYLLYQIPAVRDWVSLSKVHTINYTKYGTRILYPDRSFFVAESYRKTFRIEGSANTIYATYAGYKKGTMQKIDATECQLVPRGESFGVGSKQTPVNVEGFEDSVEYTVLINPNELTGWSYISYLLTNPSFVFKKKEQQSLIVIEHVTTSSWNTFIDDWPKLWSFPDGYKPFEVTARAREHAMICF